MMSDGIWSFNTRVLLIGLAFTAAGCFSVDDGEVGKDETAGEGDGDPTSGDGDGDGDPTTSGDGDPTTSGDGDPTTTGDGDPACGGFGATCSDTLPCCDGFSCDTDGTCGLGGGDGDGDPSTGDGDPGDDPWNPETCMRPSVALGVGGIEGAFCSAPCTDDTDCPAAPPQTFAACALITMDGGDPEFCALVCMPGSTGCPSGSTCKEIPNQPDVGLCTYP
jgi:hypothetical protein